MPGFLQPGNQSAAPFGRRLLAPPANVDQHEERREHDGHFLGENRQEKGQSGQDNTGPAPLPAPANVEQRSRQQEESRQQIFSSRDVGHRRSLYGMHGKQHGAQKGAIRAPQKRFQKEKDKDTVGRMQNNVEEVVSERIQPTGREVQGVAESADRTVAVAAKDPLPVQLRHVRVLLDEGDVVKHEAVPQSSRVKGDDRTGQQKAVEGDPPVGGESTSG